MAITSGSVGPLTVGKIKKGRGKKQPPAPPAKKSAPPSFGKYNTMQRRYGRSV